MTPPAKVSVTATDIALGVQEDCSQCPIALAIEAASGSNVTVSVSPWDIHAYGDNRAWEAATPEAAAEFIRRFDHGHKVVPFDFTLTWMEVPAA